MNPDTVKTKADIKNVRKEYINNLRIQQSNIQLIENAIEAIDTTGDMILQPTDNRSTSQKNADIQQLKVDVRRQLLEIMDGENATRAVEDLARENNTLLVYLANTIEEVIVYSLLFPPGTIMTVISTIMALHCSIPIFMII